MKRSSIYELLSSQTAIERVLIKGWVRTRRDSKTFSFLEINDGSCLSNMQVIVDESITDAEKLKKISTGSAVSVTGKMLPSPGKGQNWEIHADSLEIQGIAPESYPLQKKRHSDEFLRSIAHLRPRTNKYAAAFRIRSEAAYAIHSFFHDRGFKYIHTPVITGLDCEGAGELFKVTTLDPAVGNGADEGRDFFGKETYLTVSGQLAVEMFALSLGDVYTFGPTFRAENSNTRRHCAEFWMVEPEMAFCDLWGNMDIAESLIQGILSGLLDTCAEDISLFAKFVDKSLLPRLENIVSSKFVRIPYREAIQILLDSKKSFDFAIDFGKDLQSEHERFLTESYFKKPVVVYDYPKEIKPFYMRLNDDGETVAAMDVLFPQIGELIGGSQREERLDALESQMKACGISKETYWWYLDSRRFGSAPHSGFGLGFERFLMLVTGINNIRDVIPYPRTPGAIEF